MGGSHKAAWDSVTITWGMRQNDKEKRAMLEQSPVEGTVQQYRELKKEGKKLNELRDRLFEGDMVKPQEYVRILNELYGIAETALVEREKTEQENIVMRNALSLGIKRQSGDDTVFSMLYHETARGYTDKEGLKAAGLDNRDLGILFRLIPLMEFNCNLLIHPGTGKFLHTGTEIADCLGETNKRGVQRSIAKLKEAGILYMPEGVEGLAINENLVRCGNPSPAYMRRRTAAQEKGADRKALKEAEARVTWDREGRKYKEKEIQKRS